MTGQNYYEIITSLPLLQGKLDSNFDHISRISFEKKLLLLKDDDLAMIKELQDFLIWERKSMESSSDKKFKGKVIVLQSKYKNTTFQSIIQFAMQRRLLIGLLRKRISGLKEAPLSEELWAFPEIEYNIKNYWDKIDFGLKHLGKNLEGFDTFLREDESLEMEKQILQLTWDYCDKTSEEHYFDIDFLLIYAIRRSIVDRWEIATTPQDIKEKFNKLAMEAINGSEEED